MRLLDRVLERVFDRVLERVLDRVLDRDLEWVRLRDLNQKVLLHFTFIIGRLGLDDHVHTLVGSPLQPL